MKSLPSRLNEENHKWIPMTFTSALVAAEYMLKSHSTKKFEGDELEDQKERLARFALEKHVENMSYYSLFPDFAPSVTHFTNFFHKKFPHASEDWVVGNALEAAMDKIYERTKHEDSEEQKREKIVNQHVQKIFGECAGLRAKQLDKFDESLRRYKQNLFYFESINTALRKAKQQKDNLEKVGLRYEDEVFVASLDMHIGENKLGKDISVFRIIDAERMPFEIKHGTKYKEYGFLSTSFDLNYLIENIDNYEIPIILEISVPKGTEFYKFANDFESEILFGRGHTVSVLNDTYEYKNQTITKAKLL